MSSLDEARTAEAAPETPPTDDVWRHYRFNAAACIVDGGGYMGGISLLSMATILPLYVRQLTDSSVLVGLIPAIYWAGMFLPQLFVARAVAHMPRLLRYVMIVAAAERLFVVLLVPLTLALYQRPPALLLAFFLCWAGHALSTGMNWVSYFGMFAKIIPAVRRGRVSGISSALGGLLGVAGARVAVYLLRDGGMPEGFAWCFGIGAAVLTISVIPLAFVREPPGEPPAELPHVGPRQISRLLSSDPAFARFVLSQVCYAIAGAAPAFYTVHALEHLGAVPADAARFTAVLTATTVLTGPLWGYVADAAGNRRVMLAAAVLAGSAALTALLAPTLTVYYAVFLLQAAASSGTGLATLNMVLEFGSQTRTPAYIAVNSSCTMPVMALAPLVAGVVATRAGYPAVFATAAVLAAVAFLGWRGMPDPRHRADPQ